MDIAQRRHQIFFLFVFMLAHGVEDFLLFQIYFGSWRSGACKDFGVLRKSDGFWLNYWRRWYVFFGVELFDASTDIRLEVFSENWLVL